MELEWAGRELPESSKGKTPASDLVKTLQARPGVWCKAPNQTTNYSNLFYAHWGVVQATRNGVKYLKYEPPATRMEDETCNLTSPPQSGSPTS